MTSDALVMNTFLVISISVLQLWQLIKVLSTKVIMNDVINMVQSFARKHEALEQLYANVSHTTPNDMEDLYHASFIEGEKHAISDAWSHVVKTFSVCTFPFTFHWYQTIGVSVIWLTFVISWSVLDHIPVAFQYLVLLMWGCTVIIEWYTGDVHRTGKAVVYTHTILRTLVESHGSNDG